MITRIFAILSSIFLIGNCSPKLEINPQPNPIFLIEEDLERDASLPINFGYKIIWAAVKTEDTQALIEALNLSEVRKANWEEGILERESNQIFVLPPIKGWTLVVGDKIPVLGHTQDLEKSKSFLNNLSERFGEAHGFGNHGVVSYAEWMKSVNGKFQRLYYVGDSEILNFIEGTPTEIEEQWELFDAKEFKIKGEAYGEKAYYPDGRDVVEVAEAWSINPMKLEEMKNIGTFGFLGIIKN